MVIPIPEMAVTPNVFWKYAATGKLSQVNNATMAILQTEMAAVPLVKGKLAAFALRADPV